MHACMHATYRCGPVLMQTGTRKDRHRHNSTPLLRSLIVGLWVHIDEDDEDRYLGRIDNASTTVDSWMDRPRTHIWKGNDPHTIVEFDVELTDRPLGIVCIGPCLPEK